MKRTIPPEVCPAFQSYITRLFNNPHKLHNQNCRGFLIPVILKPLRFVLGILLDLCVKYQGRNFMIRWSSYISKANNNSQWQSGINVILCFSSCWINYFSSLSVIEEWAVSGDEWWSRPESHPVSVSQHLFGWEGEPTQELSSQHHVKTGKHTEPHLQIRLIKPLNAQQHHGRLIAYSKWRYRLSPCCSSLNLSLVFTVLWGKND